MVARTSVPLRFHAGPGEVFVRAPRQGAQPTGSERVKAEARTPLRGRGRPVMEKAWSYRQEASESGSEREAAPAGGRLPGRSKGGEQHTSVRSTTIAEPLPNLPTAYPWPCPHRPAPVHQSVLRRAWQSEADRACPSGRRFPPSLPHLSAGPCDWGLALRHLSAE
jgi:hypothetical protein